MNLNARGSEQVAIGGVIDPDAYGTGAQTSDYMDMGQFNGAMAIISAGDLVTNATLDAKLVQAQDSAGTGSKDISGAAITQLTQAGTDSNKQAIITVDANALDMANGFTHVALVMTLATAGGDAAGILLGVGSRTEPVSDVDLSSVDEIVNA